MLQRCFFIMLVFALSCKPKKRPILGDTDYQRTMNANFKDATKSPLKAVDRKQFSGLDFFKFDSSFVVKAKLQRTPNSEWFKMQSTTGDTTNERVYGVLSFFLKGQSFTLNVYQGKAMMTREGYEDYLFLPFIDHTNGESTYGGGRYIDLRIPKGDVIDIDFNKAYNPYCAYNEKYSCPIVPRVNTIDLEVRAGLKKFVSRI